MEREEHYKVVLRSARVHHGARARARTKKKGKVEALLFLPFLLFFF